jgi:lysophospholipase L1-like esterase
MKSKQLLINLGLVTFGVVLAVFIVEGVLRLIGFGSSPQMFDQYEFDDVLGWTTKTSFESYRSRRHSGHFSYYNADGFPVLKDDWKRPTDRSAPTIAFIGDSFTEGSYLPYKYTFPHLVDEKIPDRQVINLGVGGYAPDQYLLNARRKLGDFNVTDVVVMFVGSNDVPEIAKETLNGFAKPLFGDELDQPLNLPLKKLRGDTTEPSFTRRMANSSSIFRLAKPALVKYILRPIGLGNKSIWTPRAHPALDTLEENNTRKAMRLIKQIELEFPVNRFIVYYVPQYEQSLDGGALEHNIGVYLDICGELNLECYTPEKLLKETPNTADLYIPLDVHFSKTGARRVAEEIYDILGNQVAGDRSSIPK